MGNIINDAVYKPNETRETGWTVRNITDKPIIINANLSLYWSDDENMDFNCENSYFTIQPNQKKNIPIRIKAPSVPKTYNSAFVVNSLQMNAHGDDKKLCDVLKLCIRVTDDGCIIQ